MVFLSAFFILTVAGVVYVKRRPLAEFQAMTLGGSVLPGCVIAEVIALLLIAVAIVVAHVKALI